MNQTGVASTGWRRQALRKRLPRIGQWVTLSRLRARPTRSSSHNGLNRSSAPSSRSSVDTASSRK